MKFLIFTALLSILVQHSCEAETGPATPDKDSVKNFAAWAKYDNVCDAKGEGGTKVKPDVACRNAAKEARAVQNTKRSETTEADNWDVMCDALEGYNCDSQEATHDIDNFADCCKNETAPGGCLSTDNPSTKTNGVTDYTLQEQCCVDCIDKNKPPTTTAPATTSDGPHSPTDGSTPSPGPTPSPSSPYDEPGTETTTTMGSSEESTENVTEPDSAIHLGPSGLLVALFAMMAAVVNIA